MAFTYQFWLFPLVMGKFGLVRFGPGFSQTEPKPIKTVPNRFEKKMVLIPLFLGFLTNQTLSKTVKNWLRYDQNHFLDHFAKRFKKNGSEMGEG
jgi:hypothetical protein